MTRQEIKDQIEALIPKAETGEQWAHICWLEEQMLQADVIDVADGVFAKLSNQARECDGQFLRYRWDELPKPPKGKTA